MAKDPKDAREKAVCRAALEALRIELALQHRDTEHGGITTADLRQALELAYDLGAARPTLRSVRGGDSPEARAEAAEAAARDLELRVRAMRDLADERVNEAARLELRVLELEQRIRELERAR